MKKLVTAIVSLTAFLLPLAAGATAGAVKVECSGNCQNVSPNNACSLLGADFKPYAVSCANTVGANNWATEYLCGSSSRAWCQEKWFPGEGWQSLDEWCFDQNGNDAVVMCSNGSGTPTIPIASTSFTTKVECSGDCRNMTLGAACGRYNMVPSGVTCDSISSVGNTWTSCGSGSCTSFSLNNYDTLDTYCNDGDGWDAIIECTYATSPRAKLAKVECQGNCENVTVGQACARAGGTTPLHIACANPAYPGTGSRYYCGTGNAQCITWGALVSSDPIGAYCGDINGIDAIVTCE